MHTLLRSCVLATALAATLPAHAADDALYRALGAGPGLSALMTDFVGRLKADARIGHHFKDTKRDHLAKQLADQVCIVTGGSCVYDGESMAKSHKELGITRSDFNRLVEVLQDAMDARGIDFPVQNALLALLAPMYRDIITR